MDKTKKYLAKRLVTLTERRNKCAVQYNENQFVIVETNKAINKIKVVSDEAMEIFSPKVRENNSFNKQEINDMKMKIVTLVQQNKDLHAQIKKFDSEIQSIKECIDEISIDMKNSLKSEDSNSLNENNVSRETIGNHELSEKLRQIKELIFTDQQRAVVELDNILKNTSD